MGYDSSSLIDNMGLMLLALIAKRNLILSERAS
jgi:hypothetical protein